MFLFYVHEHFACMYVYMCVMCMPGFHRHQKRDLDSLELEVQAVVTHHVLGT